MNTINGEDGNGAVNTGHYTIVAIISAETDGQPSNNYAIKTLTATLIIDKAQMYNTDNGDIFYLVGDTIDYAAAARCQRQHRQRKQHRGNENKQNKRIPQRYSRIHKATTASGSYIHV